MYRAILHVYIKYVFIYLRVSYFCIVLTLCLERYRYSLVYYLKILWQHNAAELMSIYTKLQTHGTYPADA